MPNSLDLSYPAILNLLSEHLASGRLESRAFLAWFLEHYFRLEANFAQDCVCDGPDDKGIDGLYVDNNLEQVTLFQSRLFQNTAKTLGDKALREFGGALTQFSSPEGIHHITQETRNVELASLLRDEDVASKVRNGYEIVGIFVTNVAGDDKAHDFVSVSSRIRLMDKSALRSGFISEMPQEPVNTPVVFDITGFDVIDYKTRDARVIVAPLRSTELVDLDGIQNGELFDWNVRQSLGKTRVNKAISESIRNPDEHRNFLLYHNGLTILAEKVVCDQDRITVSGYSVVNGCQSLTSLFENKQRISNELRIIGRLIEISPNSDLAAKITRHTNNQNSIGHRDLQSNSRLQRRLQKEMSQEFPDVFYEIKRGENPGGRNVLTNETVARILLAFDLKQPWSCHQTYKLFDELHAAIFARPEVTAHRVIALNEAYEAVHEVLDRIDLELLARYRLVQFLLLYLLRKALEAEDLGLDFCKRPEAFVENADARAELRKTFVHMLEDIVDDLNGEVEERQEDEKIFEYKRELKSPQAVRKLERSIITMYRKAIKRGRASGFEEIWKAECGPGQ